MRSFVDLDRTFGSQPRELGAGLARIDTGKGQERLFQDQKPELLQQLSEHARVASITASNRVTQTKTVFPPGCDENVEGWG